MLRMFVIEGSLVKPAVALVSIFWRIDFDERRVPLSSVRGNKSAVWILKSLVECDPVSFESEDFDGYFFISLPVKAFFEDGAEDRFD